MISHPAEVLKSHDFDDMMSLMTLMFLIFENRFDLLVAMFAVVFMFVCVSVSRCFYPESLIASG